MSVTYFHPPGCETNNEETCPQKKIDEICGEGEDDIITYDRIRAPFLESLTTDGEAPQHRSLVYDDATKDARQVRSEQVSTKKSRGNYREESRAKVLQRVQTANGRDRERVEKKMGRDGSVGRGRSSKKMAF